MNEKTANFSASNTRTTMRTTDVTMNLNMGFQDGPNERRMDETELQGNYSRLKCHMCNMLPMPEDLGLESQVEKIAFKTLEIGGKWTSCEYGTWASLTKGSPVTYAMQLVVSIIHKHPLSFASVAAIIENIYDNGTSHSFAPEEDDNYFLNPYYSAVSDLDDGICCGH